MMNRRNFIRTAAGASLPLYTARSMAGPSPLAITMWEFSWLERRWPGAGYEDWDRALSELVERGYNAVRIDAFPHLVADHPTRRRKLIPHWDNQLWGSPFYTEIQVQPNLNEFIRKCRQYGVKVALSTWWREDEDELARKIRSPRELGEVWKKTLDSIKADGLMDNILYVDLSNEYSIEVWTPYLPKNTQRNSPLALRYMRESIALLKESYPAIPFCFSITSEFEKWESEDTSAQDLLELHIWIANSSEFNREVGYNFQRFGNDDYQKLQLNGQRVYREKEAYWLGKLKERIELAVKWSEKARLPLATTECWGPIDYKDMPLLDWQWVKEACDYGVREACRSGRWAAIATSNFCGPQFIGMWRDVEWHRRLTSMIRQAPIDSDLLSGKLVSRLNTK